MSLLFVLGPLETNVVSINCPCFTNKINPRGRFQMYTTLTYFNIQKRLLEIGVFDGASLKLWGNLCLVLMYHPSLFVLHPDG